MQCPQPSILQQLLDETLPADQQEPVQAHLESCADCQKTVERLAAGGVTWDKTAENLGEKPAVNETALIDAVEELQETPTKTGQDGDNSKVPADVDLNFLQPPQRPGSLGRLDHYEILSVVGKGGFGIVLKAFDDSLHRVVAIKALSPQLAANGSARQRFVREARAAAPITHENVVTIHEVKGDVKNPYLVMQFVSGQTLAEKIEQAGALCLKEILRIGMQIAEGLAAAQKHGLVHRDIKPGNILLENGVERVKITDFGLARAADDASITQSGMVAGTPMYMSPEQASGEPFDHRSDLFSLGSVLYVMCTGHPPFRASTTMAVMRRVCDETPRQVHEVNPDVPVWLSELVAKLHAKKPAERYQSAREVADLLGQHLADLQTGRAGRAEGRKSPKEKTTVSTAGPPPAPTPARPRRRWLAGVPVFAGVFVIAVVLGWRYWPRHEDGPPSGEPALKVGQPNPETAKLALQQAEASAQAAAAEVQFRAANLKRMQELFKVGAIEKKVLDESKGHYDAAVEREKAAKAALATAKAALAAAEVSVEQEKAGASNLQPLQLSTPPGAVGEPGWLQLFNGKDLANWWTDQADKWQVTRGVLVGAGPCSLASAQSLRDFHCRIEAKMVGAGPASADFRFTSGTTAQAILDTPFAKARTGSLGLYRAPKAQILAHWSQPPAAKDDWFNLEIVAVGKNATIKVNGVTTAEQTIQDMPDRGKLRLNIAEPGTEVHFRKIEIKELPAELPLPPLAGQWMLVGGEADGKPLPNHADLRLQINFGAKDFEFVTSNLRLKGIYRVDLAKKLIILQFFDKLETLAEVPCRFRLDEKGLGLELPAEMFLKSRGPEAGPKDSRARLDFTRLDPGGVQLFNGKDLTGWKVMGHAGWKAQDGVLVGESNGPHGWLMSDKDYADFELSLEYKMTAGSNSGVFLRAWPEGPISGGQFTEIQLIDDAKVADPRDRTGAIFSVVAPDPAPSAAVNQWHRLHLRAQGRQVQVTFDDQKILAANLDDHKDSFARFPGLTKATGRIGLQLYPGHTEFKNIRVKELPPPPPAETGWTTLFGGKDLAGWKSSPPDAWKVEDGQLVAVKGASLRSERSDFANFRLKVEAKYASPEGGGIDLRNTRTVKGPLGWYRLAFGKSKPFAPGSISVQGVNRVAGTAPAPAGLAHPDQWFTLEVVADGKRLKSFLDGKPAAIFLDEDRPIGQGAIEIWSEKAGGFRVRKIEIKELPPEATPLEK